MEQSESPPSAKSTPSRGQILEPLANPDTPVSKPVKSLSPDPLSDLLIHGRAPRKLPPILSRTLLDSLPPKEELPNMTNTAADGFPALETAPVRSPSLPRNGIDSPKKEIMRTSPLAPLSTLTPWRPLSKLKYRSLQKPPSALPQDKEFVDLFANEAAPDVDRLPPLPRVDSFLSDEPTAHAPTLQPPSTTITANNPAPRLSKTALFSLIAIPVLIVLNIFLIVFIVVPAFSGNVNSSSGAINILGVVSVDASSSRVGIGQPDPQAQLEV